MNAYPRQKKVPFTRGLVVSIIGVLVILAIVGATFFFIRYRQAGNKHVDASQSQVVISQPGNMAQFPAGSPIEVQVNAVGHQPFTSIELWINGVLEGVQAGPQSGLTSLASGFSWIPPSGGNFSLVARAINSNHDTFVSSAVFIFINPPETGTQPDLEEGKVHPDVYPGATTEQSNPQSPPAGELPAPAVPWQGTPGDWLTGLSTSSAPTAPELAATADGCNVKIDIHDLSDNEEGFALYRQTTASPYWAHAADLASHAEIGWIETKDLNLSGGITYYVAAFNSQGQSSSNLALVNLDPQACPAPQPSPALTTLDVKVSNLALDGSTGSVYCYSNLGGRGWLRWPETGFLTSGDQEIPLLAKSLLLSSLSDSGITPGPQTMELKLECWGWEGEKLRRLGTFMDTLDLATPQAIHAVLPGMTFDVFPHVVTGMKRETFELGGEIPTWPIDINPDPYYVENLGFVPESDQMPLVDAFVTSYKPYCEDHILEPSYKETFCAPMPGFTGPSGDKPQFYLIWSVDPSANNCKGYPDKECFSLDWWQHFTKSNPDPSYPDGLRFFVVSQTFSSIDGSPAGSIGEQAELFQQAWRILPDQPTDNSALCKYGYRYFQVALDAMTSLGEFTSYSSQVMVPCVKALGEGDTVKVEVTFDSMDLENLDEDPADNVYGQFTARVNGQLGPTLRVGEWLGEWWIPIGTLDFNPSLGNGWYNLADFQLCLEGPGTCVFEHGWTSSDYYKYNNNKQVVTLRNGDALQLFAELYDSSDNVLCYQYVWVGPRTIVQWASTVNEGYNLISEYDATCNVLAIIKVVPPYP